MKTSAALIVVAIAGTANAFVPPQTPRTSTTSLYANSAAKGRTSQVKKSISTATKDNFSSVLTDIETFLTKEAGNGIYKKSMNRLQRKAKLFGATVPEGYAKDAKCIAKRREKQDAYCKAKAEEAAEAAAAAAAAGAPAEGEAAPAE